jgi:hypothetical protein
VLTERFIWQHGAGNRRRVMHLASFNRLGGFAGALCGISLTFDRSCNLPLGKRTCKRCLKIEREFAA